MQFHEEEKMDLFDFMSFFGSTFWPTVKTSFYDCFILKDDTMPT